MKRLLALVLLISLPGPALAGQPSKRMLGLYANLGAYNYAMEAFRQGDYGVGCKALAEGIYIAKAFGNINYSADVKAMNDYCNRY